MFMSNATTNRAVKQVTNTTEEASKDPLSFLTLAMFGGTGAAIEAQEARGQSELVESEELPTKINNRDERDGEAAFVALGFKFGEPIPGDPMFRHATLPEGWKKRPTSHSMWSEIVDEHDRPRVAIFYKAAFYDRSSHMSLTGRWDFTRLAGDDEWVVKDRKTGKVAFTPVAGLDRYEACQEWMRALPKMSILEQWTAELAHRFTRRPPDAARTGGRDRGSAVVTYKISIEEFEEPIEMPKRYMVCTKELDEFDPHVELETNDIDAAQLEANAQLNAANAADIVRIYDTHERCGVSIRKPKRLVMRKARMQGHDVVMAEVAS